MQLKLSTCKAKTYTILDYDSVAVAESGNRGSVLDQIITLKTRTHNKHNAQHTLRKERHLALTGKTVSPSITA
jgi:hypothetical protein